MGEATNEDAMKTYRASFYGRTVNALGVRYTINMFVSGKNRKEAELKLYDDYEHIQCLTLEEVK